MGVTFAGTDDSVIFSGSASDMAFDNITLGASMPGRDDPEPVTLTLTRVGPARPGRSGLPPAEGISRFLVLLRQRMAKGGSGVVGP